MNCTGRQEKSIDSKVPQKKHWSSKGALADLAALCVLTIGISLHLPAQPDQARKPMQAKLEDGAEYRWLQKKVLASRLLDNMEDISAWSFKGEGDMALSSVFRKDGQHALRIQSKFNIARTDGSGEWEDLVATRKFQSEDWRKYNRLSLWVYADVAGAPALSASLTLHNEGAHLLPDQFNEGRDESLMLKNHDWTHWCGRSHPSIVIRSRHLILLTACQRCFPIRGPYHPVHRPTGIADGGC